MYWDLLVIMLSVYNCIMIPIGISYGDDFFTEEAIFIINYLEFVIDGIFVSDIIASFRTTYLDTQKGKEITDPKAIAKRYFFSGNLFVDICSTVPIDEIIENFIEINVRQVGLLGLLKMTRMLRLRKIIAFMNV
jgi:hypothetical protein